MDLPPIKLKNMEEPTKKKLNHLTIESVSNGFIITEDIACRSNVVSSGSRAVVNSIGELVVYLSENYE